MCCLFVLLCVLLLHFCIILLICASPLLRLCPYTTLFRSQWMQQWTFLTQIREELEVEIGSAEYLSTWNSGSRLDYQHVLQDRKSTRLNSSHLVISYAVFRLQKQNQLRELRRTRESNHIRV